MSWTVTGISTAEQAAIKNIRLSFKNLEADECVIELSRDFSASITKAGSITVSLSGTVVFRGSITRSRRFSDGRSHGAEIVALGPWASWERLPVHGILRTVNYLSKYWEAQELYPALVFTGSDQASSLLTLLSGIAPDVALAGTMSVPARTIPALVSEHATVADAIREVVRYLPRARSFFDYSQNPPRFRVVDINSSVLNYTPPADATGKIDIEELNPDISGVVIDHYRRVSVTDYRTGQRETRPSYIVRRDVAGSWSIPGVGTLWRMFTDPTPINQYIFKIPPSSTPSYLTTQPEVYTDKQAFVSFWSRYGYSTQGRPQQITAAYNPVWDFKPISEVGGPGIPLNQWRMLEQGAEIPQEFMYSLDNPSGLVVGDFKVFQEITVSFGYSAPGVVWTRQPYIRYETDQIRMYRSASGGIPAGRTDLIRVIPSVLPALPANFAGTLLADNNAVKKSGTASLVFGLIPLSSIVGVNRWTVAGETLDPIQQIDVDAFSGRVTARFGVASQLGPQDFLALQRPSR